MFRVITGRKDKNGVEIYEGDIFKWSLPAGFQTIPYEPFPLPFLSHLCGAKSGCLTDDYVEIAVVEKDGEQWVLRENGDPKGMVSFLGGEFCDGSHRCEHGEVIGNIYENPELLKPAQ